MSSNKNCFKDIVKTAHWIGHSEIRSLDTDDFFKITPVVDEKQYSVTGNTTRQSVSGGKRIHFYYKKEK